MLLHRARALSFMRRHGLDVLIATSPVNVTYFTDYHYWADPLLKHFMGSPGASGELATRNYAVFPADAEPALVLPPLIATNATDLWVRDVRVYGSSGLDNSLIPATMPEAMRPWFELVQGPLPATAIDALVAALHDRSLECAQIGLELDGLPPAIHAALQAALPDATIRDCSNMLRLIRAVKSPEEIRRLTRAAEIAEAAAAEGLALAEPGRPLSEIVDAFRAGVGARGADLDHLIFGLYGLGIASEPKYRLQTGDAMLVDFGCVYQHYFSDSGVTLAIGDLPEPLVERYDALRDSLEAGAMALKPGVLASEVRGAMRVALQERGITTSFAHGHGFGLEMRDYPIIVEDNGLRIKDDCVDVPSDLPFEVDMVINLETPLYLAGAGTLHLERSFVVTPDGSRPLIAQDRSRPIQAAHRIGNPI